MKISGIQIFWLLFTFLTGNTILLTINEAIFDAKQDAWISLLITSAIAFLLVIIYTKVGLLHPNETLIQLSKTILGKWLGNLVIIIYLINWYAATSVVLSQFADFTNTILLYSTPQWIINLMILLLIIYLLYIGGIEGIARCAEFFGPIILIMSVLLFCFSISNIDVQRILPIYADSGITSIMKGTLLPLSFFGETVIILMLIKFMDEPKNAPKSALWAIGISSFLVTSFTFMVITVFGANTAAKMRYSAFDLVSVISIMNFIQNLEVVAVVIWILSVFIKLALYIYVASYGTAQWLKIKDWRKPIWIISVLAFIIVQIYPNITLYNIEYTIHYRVPFVLPINLIGIPIVLWIVGSIRKRMSRKKSSDFSS